MNETYISIKTAWKTKNNEKGKNKIKIPTRDMIAKVSLFFNDDIYFGNTWLDHKKWRSYSTPIVTCVTF